MKQVFLNLFLNAIQAMDENGTLTTTIRATSPGRRATKLLLISIKDTGCGISRDNITHIFDRYYTTKEAGTGLGLAIVERVVEAHNGKLDVISEVGKGTTFNIDLPVNTHG